MSHLDSPAALITNVTPETGHFLAVQLVGTKGSRDAIGTILRITAGGREFTAHLTAGDGYMATNQRQVVFGQGSAKQVDVLRIRWPGGAEQQFETLAADQQLVIVEGRTGPLTLPR